MYNFKYKCRKERLIINDIPMSRDVIMVNETLANLFEWYIQTIIYHDHKGIIPGIQVQFIKSKIKQCKLSV